MHEFNPPGIANSPGCLLVSEQTTFLKGFHQHYNFVKKKRALLKSGPTRVTESKRKICLANHYNLVMIELYLQGW
jgi:hypothetical protein